MSLFVFGLGYSARAVVEAMRAESPDLSVSGTTRDTGRFQAFAEMNVAPHVFSGEAPGDSLVPDLLAANRLVVAIAPDETGDPVLRHHRGEVLAAPALTHITYLSTIGVYGDAGGDWVDESRAVPGPSRRARRRVEAEAAWRHLAEQKGVPLLVLRLAGIYGPGRSVFDKLRAGTARRIIKPGQVFNRIHRDDIGATVVRAAGRGLGGLFNLADDLPAPPQEVMEHAAGLLGIEPPPEIAFADAPLSPMARAFYADNKRVANAAIKRALALSLAYPTYREGLAAILASERAG